MIPNSVHIIEDVRGWREGDYDGYNDYYVNPEFSRSERTRKRIENQQDQELKQLLNQ